MMSKKRPTTEESPKKSKKSKIASLKLEFSEESDTLLGYCLQKDLTFVFLILFKLFAEQSLKHKDVIPIVKKNKKLSLKLNGKTVEFSGVSEKELEVLTEHKYWNVCSEKFISLLCKNKVAVLTMLSQSKANVLKTKYNSDQEFQLFLKWKLSQYCYDVMNSDIQKVQLFTKSLDKLFKSHQLYDLSTFHSMLCFSYGREKINNFKKTTQKQIDDKIRQQKQFFKEFGVKSEEKMISEEEEEEIIDEEEDEDSSSE